MTLDYPFSSDEMLAAYDAWRCNCGPTALAFACQLSLEEVRGVIPGFEEKGYTTPTMMAAALAKLGRSYKPDPLPGAAARMFAREPSLVRIQWTGPWTEPGANPKWSYRFTHWVCAYSVEGQCPMVFDCNGGILPFSRWRDEVVPELTKAIRRADGGWHPTHIWRLM